MFTLRYVSPEPLQYCVYRKVARTGYATTDLMSEIFRNAAPSFKSQFSMYVVIPNLQSRVNNKFSLSTSRFSHFGSGHHVRDACQSLSTWTQEALKIVLVRLVHIYLLLTNPLASGGWR